MRKLSFVLVASAAILFAAPGFAQTSQAMNPVTNSASDSRTSMSQPTNPPPTGDASLDEVVCKTQPPPTGTRIGSQRVCKTNREWLQDEDAMNRQRNMNSNTDFSHGAGSGLGGSTAGMGH
jgi:hypothetical protein